MRHLFASPNMSVMTARQIVAESEIFMREIGRESVGVFAGLKDEAQFDDIFKRHSRLFTAESLETVRCSRLKQPARGEMVSFITVNLIEKEIQADNDRYLTEEGRAAALYDGRSIPLRALPIAMVNEPDAEERRAMERARRKAQAKLNGLLERPMRRTHEAAAELGFASYKRMFEELEGIDLDSLGRDAEAWLKKTRKRYAAGLERYCGKYLGVAPENLDRSDLAYLRRAKFLDELFKGDRLIPTVWKTLREMGIDPEKNRYIHLDMEPREKKSPRACCIPVRTPQEVHLVMAPHGGVDDYAAFLHEMGHTLHFSGASPKLHFTARFLGDNSVTECWAMTLEYLLLNRRWLRDALGIRNADEVADFFEFVRMYMIRRYLSKLLYELELHGGAAGRKEWPGLYRGILSEAGMAAYGEEDYLKDVDSYFYCARYLRAWMLEAAVRRALVSRFGEKWFGKRGAGEMLRGFWRLGQSARAEDVAAMLGEKMKLE